MRIHTISPLKLFVFMFGFILPTQHIFGQCDPQRDSLILVDLYNSTKGTEWLRDNNWLTASPLKSWYGVILTPQGCVGELNLNSNKLEGPMPNQITNLREIIKLNLNDNRLTIGNTTDSLPNGWVNLQKLEVLNLSSNILGGPINAELGTLTNLKILNLSLNFFSKSLPANLGNLPNIRQILLNQNELTGQIPASFGQMKTLEELILSQNMLSGNLPAQLGNLSNLRVFSITDNDIDGVIPSNIGNLSSVQFLYMNENSLSGSIPVTFGNLPNLRELWLNNNQLSGTIPQEIANATNLRKLLLNDNMLIGSLPAVLTSMTNLTALHVSNNQMNGIIPSTIVDLNNLESLLLNDNNFTGTIPVNIGLLTKLTSFQIQNNQISGFLPESLGDIPNLKRIYFHNNKLQGCFPQSYRKFCPLKLSLNTNANGFNFLDNENLLFSGDFSEWCRVNYVVNGEFTSNAPLCEGNTLVLSAVSANMNYNWEGPNGFTSTLQEPTIQNFSTLSVGTYQLTVTDFSGCTGTSNQEIALIGTGDIQVNSPLCEGKTIQFTVSPGINYVWSGPNNFTSTLQNPSIPNATKAMEGKYMVKIETSDCTIEKTIDVVLTSIGSVTTPEPVCLGQNLTLDAAGGTAYRWKGPNNFTSTLPNPTIVQFNTKNQGIYTVEISDNTGCISIFDIPVDYKELEIPTVEDLGSLCPESDPLLLPKQQGNYTGTWTGPGVTTIGDDFYFDPSGKKGSQELIFNPAPSFTCVSTATSEIFVNQLSVLVKESAPNTSALEDNGSFVIQFSGDGNNFQFSWNGPTQGSATSDTPGSLEINNVPPGLYNVQITNDLGCFVQDNFTIRNFYSQVLVPNVISKSGSLPENSIFTVYGKNISQYDISVYDRWGNQAFQANNLPSNDTGAGWDISSSPLQTGTYVLFLTLYLPSGVEQRIETLLLLE